MASKWELERSIDNLRDHVMELETRLQIAERNSNRCYEQITKGIYEAPGMFGSVLTPTISGDVKAIMKHLGLQTSVSVSETKVVVTPPRVEKTAKKGRK